MTNEEAIKTLKANYPDACYEQLREAVDAAIKALKAQDAADDTISRQAVFDALRTCYDTETVTMSNGDEYINYEDAVGEIEQLSSAQPKLNKGKISNLLWNEYRIMSPHLSAEGVVAKRYYCKELWKELFGEEETPVWMTW